MVKTASLNAAPKNHVGTGGVNQPAAISAIVRKVAGTAKTLTFGAAIGLVSISLLSTTATAQTAGSGLIVGTGTGNGAIRLCGGGERR